MKQIPNIIKEVIVTGMGDPSVGIFSFSATITGDPIIEFSNDDTQEDRNSIIDDFASTLKFSFANLWDDEIRIMFDFEYEEPI